MIPNDCLKALKSTLGKKELLTDPSDTYAYGYDNSRKQHSPDAVALPQRQAQVEAIVAACNEFSVPITCRGRASGTTGGAIPIKGGLVLSLERMDQILDYDPSNRIMIVEPGVLNETVQQVAGKQNFFWAPDPSSSAYCTVGGNLACNAAGPRAVKYGTTRENVLGLEAVLSNGTLLKSGVHTTKGVVGYDFTRLMIGSEGTLGVITKATLKLLPKPKGIYTIQALYDSIQGAVSAIVSVMSQPVIPCALELIDDKSVDLIRNHQKVAVPEKAKAMLIIEVDGSEQSLKSDAQQVIESLSNKHLIEVNQASNANEAKQIWATRKALSPALRSLSPHKINEDVVVPVMQMPIFFEKIEAISKTFDIPIVNFGHGGNGNIHVNLLADPLCPTMGPKAHQALEQLFDLVIELDGTLSGEHGVGIEKRDFVYKEINQENLNLMRQVKKVFDPKGIMNPGKFLP